MDKFEWSDTFESPVNPQLNSPASILNFLRHSDSPATPKTPLFANTFTVNSITPVQITPLPSTPTKSTKTLYVPTTPERVSSSNTLKSLTKLDPNNIAKFRSIVKDRARTPECSRKKLFKVINTNNAATTSSLTAPSNTPPLATVITSTRRGNEFEEKIRRSCQTDVVMKQKLLNSFAKRNNSRENLINDASPKNVAVTSPFVADNNTPSQECGFVDISDSQLERIDEMTNRLFAQNQQQEQQATSNQTSVQVGCVESILPQPPSHLHQPPQTALLNKTLVPLIKPAVPIFTGPIPDLFDSYLSNQEPTPAIAPPQFTGFVSGKGKKIEPVNTTRAKELFGDLLDDEDLQSYTKNEQQSLSTRNSVPLNRSLFGVRNKNIANVHANSARSQIDGRENAVLGTVSDVNFEKKDEDKRDTAMIQEQSSVNQILPSTTFAASTIESSSAVFVGFKTGSGKKVVPKNLERTNNLFIDIFDEFESLDKTLTDDAIGFSNSSMKISREHANVDAIGPQDLYMAAQNTSPPTSKKVKTGHLFEFGDFDADATGKREPEEFVGFRSGSGKKIVPKNLDKSKTLFADILDDFSMLKDDDLNVSDMRTPKKTLGLPTTLNENQVDFDSTVDGIAASDNTAVLNTAPPATKKVKYAHFFKNFEVGDFGGSKTEDDDTGFIGFRSGSGKKVAPKNLDSARRLFADILNDEIASGIEEIKSKQFEQEDGIDDWSTLKTSPSRSSVRDNPSDGFVGFTSGSGKKINAKLNSATVAKGLFGDILSEDFELPVQDDFVGFKSGGGKLIAVSNVERGKDLFSDILGDDFVSNFGAMESTSNGFIGFKSGGGKPIQVSDTEKAKDLFKDIFENEIANDDDAKEIPAAIKTPKSLRSTLHVKNDILVGFETPLRTPTSGKTNGLRKSQTVSFRTPKFTSPMVNPSLRTPNSPTPNNTSSKGKNLEVKSSVSTSTSTLKIAGRGFTSPITPIRAITKPMVRGSTSSSSGLLTPLSGMRKRRQGFMSPSIQDVSEEKREKVVIPVVFDLEACKSRDIINVNVSKRQSVSHDDLRIKFDIPVEVLHMTLKTAETYQFFDNDKPVDIEYIIQKMSDHGAQSNLLKPEWVRHHYKMIVWKLACFVRSYPEYFTFRWKFNEVLDCLRYRYELEINQAKSSCLKRILEQDNSPVFHMVLCISNIIYGTETENSNSQVMIELTDGWYCVRARMDQILQNAVRDKKIYVGQKLHICGAHLHASSGPSPPLETPESTTLSITANGVKRARHDAKLGYQKQSVFVSGIGSTVNTGGIIPLLDVIVMRKYQVMYVETVENAEGERRQTYRSEREEEREKVIWQYATDDLLQKLMMEGEKAIEQEMKKSEDYQRIQQKYEELRDDVLSKVEELRPARKVQRLLKLRVCDYPLEDLELEKTQVALVSLWGVTDDWITNIGEGKRYKIQNLIPQTFRENNMHITLKNSKNTRLMRCKSEDRIPFSRYLPRKNIRCDEFDKVAKGEEVDLIGVVIFVGSVNVGKFSNISGQLIAITDTSKSIVVLKSVGSNHVWKANTVIQVRNAQFQYYHKSFRTNIIKSSAVLEVATKPVNQEAGMIMNELEAWLKSADMDLESLSVDACEVVNGLKDF